METGLIHGHSFWRWVVAALILITFIKALIGWFGKSEYSKADAKLATFSMISMHIQLVLGLALFFVSSKVNFELIGENAMARLWTVEHPTMMILAIVLVTIARSKTKGAGTETSKYKKIAIMFGIAILLIALAIPAEKWI